MQREQCQDLELAARQQQLGRAGADSPATQHRELEGRERGGGVGGGGGRQQASERRSGRHREGVRAVPGRRQVQHAQDGTAARIAQRHGVADPAVDGGAVVLGRVDRRGLAGAQGERQRVGADRRLVPVTARDEPDPLAVPTHDPAAVRPHDAPAGVGDAGDQPAVVSGTADVGFDGAQTSRHARPAPRVDGRAVAVDGRGADLGADRGPRATPGVQDAPFDQVLTRPALTRLALFRCSLGWDGLRGRRTRHDDGPGPRELLTTAVQLVPGQHSRGHGAPRPEVDRFE